jgi:ubiquinone/menaquinone biosynthesis C-methylase UbiE
MQASSSVSTPPPANPNKALWEMGDFTAIAATMRESGEAFAQSLTIIPGMRVLDLGCGDGTTALPIARLGANVTGIDIAANLVAAGNRRAAAAGLVSRLKFQEGDACQLSEVADRQFDLTVTVFGAMFASKPLEVANEMVRVTKAGGRIVMGNWIPNDPSSFVSQVLKISSAFTPPPPEGSVSPMLWGVENNILDRFGQAGVSKERITLARDTFYFRSSSLTPVTYIDLFRKFYGPTMNAFAAAEKNGKADELNRQLVDQATAHNKSTGPGIVIPATFMRVTVQL